MFATFVRLLLVATLLMFSTVGSVKRANGETLHPEVSIGIIAPLTGSTAIYGRDVQRLIEILPPYLPQIAPHARFKFFLENGECGHGNATMSAYQKLYSLQGVRFFVVSCSGEALQIGEIANHRKTVVVAFASSHPDISKLGEYVFRTYPSMTQGAKALATMIRRRSPGPLALISEENSFTIGLRDLLSEELGATVVYSADYPQEESDFRSVLTLAKRKAPVAFIVNAASPRTYLALYSQLRQFGFAAPVFSYFQPSAKEVLEVLGAKQDGVRFLDVPEGKATDPVFERIFNEFLTRNPKGPELEALLRSSYDSISSIARAVDAVGSDPTAVKDYLSANTLPGALGDIRYDSNGDRPDLRFSILSAQWAYHSLGFVYGCYKRGSSKYRANYEKLIY